MPTTRLREGNRYTLDEVKQFLRTATGIRRCGDSLEEVEGRNGRPVDINQLFPPYYAGPVHFNPTTEKGQPHSEKFLYRTNPDEFIYVGLTLGY
ncbi:MAG: hypothetical protein HYT72_04740 [Candidatus Aenigmarchaeota archaeon]|nr:hypothetical protein [Candidatus Aenigmarchaeota archaeon]